MMIPVLSVAVVQAAMWGVGYDPNRTWVLPYVMGILLMWAAQLMNIRAEPVSVYGEVVFYKNRAAMVACVLLTLNSIVLSPVVAVIIALG